MADLAPPYRDAISILLRDELSQKQLAAHLDVSASGARSRVQRARKQVLSRLARSCDVELDAHGNVVRCEPRRLRP